MVGGLMQAARADVARFAADATNGFAVSATITTPDNSVSLAVTGLGTGTWMLFENMRNDKPVNGTSNSYDIPENQLIAAGYPYKNGRGLVSLLGHKVIVTDGVGLSGTYEVTEQHPNATVGLMVLILGKKL